MKAAREAPFEAQPDLAPDKRVFLDETAAAANRARRYGRAPRGERCRLMVSRGHYRSTTVTAALRSTGLCALDSAQDATDGQCLRAYGARCLVPGLRPGDTAILDGLQAHKVGRIRERVETAGARLLYGAPYSPAFEPIE